MYISILHYNLTIIVLCIRAHFVLHMFIKRVIFLCYQVPEYDVMDGKVVYISVDDRLETLHLPSDVTPDQIRGKNF